MTTMLKANKLLNKTINAIRKKVCLYHINIHNIDYSYNKTTNIYSMIYFFMIELKKAKYEYSYYALFSEKKDSNIEIILNFKTPINYIDFFDIKMYITNVEIEENKLKLIDSNNKIIEINFSNNFRLEQISRRMFDTIIYYD